MPPWIPQQEHWQSFRSERFGAKQPELFGAIEQAFDRGGSPASSAARRAFIHSL